MRDHNRITQQRLNFPIQPPPKSWGLLANQSEAIKDVIFAQNGIRGLSSVFKFLIKTHCRLQRDSEKLTRMRD